MADGDEKAEPDRKDQTGARRRGAAKPATIDLTAREIAEPATESRAEGAAAAAEGAGERPDGDRLAEADPAAPASEEGRPAEAADPMPEAAAGDDTRGADEERPSRIPGFILAGFVGAVTGVALFLTLQFSEILPGYGQSGTEFQAQVQSTSQGLQGLADRVAAIEASAATADSEGLSERVAEIEAQLAQTDSGPAPDLSPIEARLSELETQISGLQSAIRDLPAGGGADFDERIAGLEARIEEQAEAVRTLRQEVASEVGELRGALEQSDATADREVARAAAAAIALSSLTRAVDAGQAYTAELAALEPLVGENAEVETLSAHAEDGLATAAALAEDFAAISDDILSAGDEPGEGLAARLAANARALVRVRRSGPIEGDDRTAIVSRIAGALETGDLASAYREWQSLDEAARVASTEWANRLRQRIAAETELTQLAGAISGALAAPATAD